MTLLTTPDEDLYPSDTTWPGLSTGPRPDATGLSEDEIAALRGEGVELIPPAVPSAQTFPGPRLYPGAPSWLDAADTAPSGPTLERLWELATYDPLFYRNLVAAAGYIQQSWFAQSKPPPQIEPYIPPRPVPEYSIDVMGDSAVGEFEGQTAPMFGETPA